MASSPSGDYDSMNGTEKDTAMDGDDQRRQRKGKGPAQITFQFCREWYVHIDLYSLTTVCVSALGSLVC